MTDAEKEDAFTVELRELPAWQLAYVRVANSFEGDRVREALGRVLEWARGRGLLEAGTLLGMSTDDPTVTPSHLYRYEACFASESSLGDTDGLSRMTLPARTYAVARVDGDIRHVATGWDYLFRGWLVRSDFEPVNAPAFEVFRDKAAALDWSTFSLDLCLPVQRMNTMKG